MLRRAVLRSPSGVASNLASFSQWDSGDNYEDFTLTSTRHWGESGQGVWKLEILDYDFRDDGTFASATLKLNGTAAPAAQITTQSGFQFIAEGSPVTLDVTFNGFGKDMFGLNRAGFSAKTVIKRTQFGSTLYAPAIADDVELLIDVEFLKK